MNTNTFPFREKYCHNEVRSFAEYIQLLHSETFGFIPCDHFLINRTTSKIIAGYASYNIPEYSIYSGPENKTNFVIVDAHVLKKPASYHNQKAIDYTKIENWEKTI